MPQGFQNPLRDSSPCRPEGSPLYFFEISISGDGPKRISTGENILILRGGARAEKNAIFWSTFSKNGLKTPFMACFVRILPAEDQFGRPKKVDQI